MHATHLHYDNPEAHACSLANYQEVQKHHAEWNNPAPLSHAKGGGGSKSEVG